MLHENPSMVDIDVDQWRNLQDLILESGKEKRRIVVIHEQGKILKFVHSEHGTIVQGIDRVVDPLKDAKIVYNDNRGKVDFVMILERKAVEHFFAEIQDSWRITEDLDEYVNRMYAKLDTYPEGIVTYPGPAKLTLGLQWRLGTSYEELKSAVERFIPAGSTVVFGVYSKDALWTSLVIGFDTDKRVTLITTVDPTEISLASEWKTANKEIIRWVERKYPPCSLGLFMSLGSAKALITSKNKDATLRKLIETGQLVADPLPTDLARVLGGI